MSCLKNSRGLTGFFLLLDGILNMAGEDPGLTLIAPDVKIVKQYPGQTGDNLTSVWSYKPLILN